MCHACGGPILNPAHPSPRQDLIEDLKSELGGHFEDVILALVRPPADYLCKQLHKAMERMGTNEHTLIEILCSRTNSEVQDIVNAYERSKCPPPSRQPAACSGQ